MKAFFQEMAGTIADWRRALHRIPEIGMILPKTAAWIENWLQEAGLCPRRIGDGLIVDLPTATEAPPTAGIFALRADMDALPVQEESEAPYASTHPGCMHACGHDAHVAILLGVASWFVRRPPPFRVRLIFQPGEEGFAGAREMIQGGALNGVSAVAAVHVGQLFPELKTSQAGFRSGVTMAASDHFSLTLRGAGGHAATPHLTRDPVVAAARFIQDLQTLRSRELTAVHPAVISVCLVRGGQAHNVIPAEVRLEGTVRTVTLEDQAYLHRRMEALARTTAEAWELRADLRWHVSYPVVVNDPGITALVAGVARECLGEEGVVNLPEPSMGGEDMAFFLQRVPGCFWVFSTHNPDRGITAAQHTPRFDVDDSLLWRPAWISALSAYRFFGGTP